MQVVFIAPSGQRYMADAFWDGGETWRVRFCPDEVGEWRWEFPRSDAAAGRLNGKEGAFACVPYEGENPLYLHGALKLSENRRYLVHDDGTAFFWLGDTAWNGVLRSEESEWREYLQTRRSQGFSIIQFVSTQWRARSKGVSGQTAYSGTRDIKINPEFFRRLDQKVSAINKSGLVAAPVILWANTESDPGRALSQTDAISLARYIIARWGAYHVVWMLAGDGNYLGTNSQRWKHIAKTVFSGRRRLVTMHPDGQSWVGDEFRTQDWFDILGYQSGHGSSREHLLWLVAGPPASDWRKEPALPIVNLEPNYETHPSYHEKMYFGDAEVRRAAYWSLLLTPTAGVTFGHNSIWLWAREPEIPEGHEWIGVVKEWREGLDSPGVRSMSILRRFFDSLPWWRLQPAPEILLNQPGKKDDPAGFVAVAKARKEPGSPVFAVVYIPAGNEVRPEPTAFRQPLNARWFDPRLGEYRDAPRAETLAFVPPDSRDWVLHIEEQT